MNCDNAKFEVTFGEFVGASHRDCNQSDEIKTSAPMLITLYAVAPIDAVPMRQIFLL